MILLLENMLNMLKKKLVNNFKIYIFISFLFFFSSSILYSKEYATTLKQKKISSKYSVFERIRFFTYFNDTYYKQGREMPLEELGKQIVADYRLDRLYLAGVLGKPNITVSRECNVWCYCIYEYVDENIFHINSLMMFFNDQDEYIGLKTYDSYRYSKYKKKDFF